MIDYTEQENYTSLSFLITVTTTTTVATTSPISTTTATPEPPKECPNPQYAFDGDENFNVEGVRNADSFIWQPMEEPGACTRRISAERLEIRPQYDENDVNPAFELVELRFYVVGASEVRITFRKIGGPSPTATVSAPIF